MKGGRIPTGSALIPVIRHRVEALAQKHRVSRSWVVATLLADSLGIGEQESFIEPTTKIPRRPSASR
jgi:hypothetical protein